MISAVAFCFSRWFHGPWRTRLQSERKDCRGNQSNPDGDVFVTLCDRHLQRNTNSNKKMWQSPATSFIWNLFKQNNDSGKIFSRNWKIKHKAGCSVLLVNGIIKGRWKWLRSRTHWAVSTDIVMSECIDCVNLQPSPLFNSRSHGNTGYIG